MKRKHKIVIATGVISLSMITAMATGLINTGNLFAEDPTTLSSTVFSGLQNGDKIVLGGNRFVVLEANTGKLLSLDNSAGGKVKAEEIENQRVIWEKSILNTADSKLINGTSTVLDYDDLGGCDDHTCSLLPNIGNGSVFWTGSKGKAVDTRIAINANGTGRALSTGTGGVVQADFTCSGDGVDRDFFEKGSDDAPTSDPTTCKLVAIYGQGVYWMNSVTPIPIPPESYLHPFDNPNANITTGQKNCLAISSTTGTPDQVMGTIEGGIWTSTIEKMTPGEYAGMQNAWTRVWWSDLDGVYSGTNRVDLIHAGDECTRPAQADKAAVRPSVTADLSSVLFVSANGTPVDANLQEAVGTLTLLDNDIKFALASDQSTTIEAANSDTIKVKYDTTDISTGSNQNIKVIVIGKDDSGNDKIIRYETLENLDSTPSGELNIDLSSKGLNLEAGSYKLQLFNEQIIVSRRWWYLIMLLLCRKSH